MAFDYIGTSKRLRVIAQRYLLSPLSGSGRSTAFWGNSAGTRAMNRAVVAVTCLMALGASTTVAHGQLHASPFVENFVGLCLLTEAKPDMVKALARNEEWEPVPPELLPLIAPQVAPLEWDAWMVKREGTPPLLVSVSTAELDGAMIPSCAIAGEAVYSDVEDALLQFGARLINDQNEVIQISRVYEITRNGNRLLVALTLAPNVDEGLLSAGVVDPVD